MYANEFMKWSGTIKCKSWVGIVVSFQCEHGQNRNPNQTREGKNCQSENRLDI